MFGFVPSAQAGQQRGQQCGHCLCLLSNAKALIIILFFFYPLFICNDLGTSIPACLQPAWPWIKQGGSTRPGKGSLSPGSAQPGEGPDESWAKGAPSPSNKQGTAFPHSAAPYPCETKLFPTGTGPVRARCLRQGRGALSVCFAADVAEHREHHSLEGNSSRQGSDKDQAFKNMFMA